MSHWGSRRRFKGGAALGLLTALLSVSLLVAPDAVAAPSLQQTVFNQDRTIRGGRTVPVKVFCPGGKQIPFTWGFRPISLPQAGVINNVEAVSVVPDRRGKKAGFTIRLRNPNQSAGAVVQVRVSVTCVSGKRGIRTRDAAASGRRPKLTLGIEEKRARAPGRKKRIVKPKCPRGDLPIEVGYDADKLRAAFAGATPFSTKGGAGYKFEFRNEGPKPDEVTAYLSCLRGKGIKTSAKVEGDPKTSRGSGKGPSLGFIVGAVDGMPIDVFSNYTPNHPTFFPPDLTYEMCDGKRLAVTAPVPGSFGFNPSPFSDPRVAARFLAELTDNDQAATAVAAAFVFGLFDPEGGPLAEPELYQGCLKAKGLRFGLATGDLPSLPAPVDLDGAVRFGAADLRSPHPNSVSCVDNSGPQPEPAQCTLVSNDPSDASRDVFRAPAAGKIIALRVRQPNPSDVPGGGVGTPVPQTIVLRAIDPLGGGAYRGGATRPLGSIPALGQSDLTVDPPLSVAKGQLLGIDITAAALGPFYMVTGGSSNHRTSIFGAAGEGALGIGESRVPGQSLDGDLPVQLFLDKGS